jgi:hypothetical protein
MNAEVFERIERTTHRIARHSYYPGKDEVIQTCMEEIEEMCQDGKLTFDQRSRLISILETRESCLRAAS